MIFSLEDLMMRDLIDYFEHDERLVERTCTRCKHYNIPVDEFPCMECSILQGDRAIEILCPHGVNVVEVCVHCFHEECEEEWL